MSIRLKHLAFAALGAALVAVTGASVTQAQNDPISARKALMKATGESMRVIKGAVDANGPAATVATEAAKVAANLKAAAVHFVPRLGQGRHQGSTGDLGPISATSRSSTTTATPPPSNSKPPPSPAT